MPRTMPPLCQSTTPGHNAQHNSSVGWIKRCSLFLFVALKCLVELDHILKYTLPCAPTRFIVEHYCKISSSKLVVRWSVGSTTQGLHYVSQRTHSHACDGWYTRTDGNLESHHAWWGFEILAIFICNVTDYADQWVETNGIWKIPEHWHF